MSSSCLGVLLSLDEPIERRAVPRTFGKGRKQGGTQEGEAEAEMNPEVPAGSNAEKNSLEAEGSGRGVSQEERTCLGIGSIP
jgi:hypothetical protein